MLASSNRAQWVDNLLQQAITAKASDIHIEPKANKAQIRQRVLGLLEKVTNLTLWQYHQLLTRYKVLAHLDIAEHLRPQEGRFSFNYQDLTYELRLSIFPTLHGEKLVIRIIDPHIIATPLSQLGFSQTQLCNYLAVLQRSEGLILVTGPTGCGKTVTLYASLLACDSSTLNIVTLEDPVEYIVDTLSQSNILEKRGLGFDAALVALMRQDPDIILLGEIRDTTTARLAIRAAQTGHLVLASLHCSHSLDAIARLQHLQLDIDSITQTVSCIIAQRLLRNLCSHCKIIDTEADYEHYYKASTCHHCHQGYQGRTAVFETLYMTAALQKALSQPQHLHLLTAALEAQSFESLWQRGIAQAKAGLTSIKEVKRVISQP